MRRRSSRALAAAASAVVVIVAVVAISSSSSSLVLAAGKGNNQQPPSSLDVALRYIGDEKNKKSFVQDLLDLVSIPSVSSLPERRRDVERAAEWCAARLRRAGLENVQVLRASYDDDDNDRESSSPPPAVYGDWLHAGPNKAIILIYGHFDVQPADAETENWTKSPPFKPVVDGGAVWGRGAQDDKGGLLGAVQAVEAYLQGAQKKSKNNKGKEFPRLPVNVKFLLEGEEEVGSPNLDAFLRKHRNLLECDGALSADGGQPSASLGGVTMGLRGAAAFELAVETLSADVHSGSFGGSVANAASALAAAVLSLHDPGTRRVAIRGFYDGIPSSAAPRGSDRDDVRDFEAATVVEEEEEGDEQEKETSSSSLKKQPRLLFNETEDLASIGAAAAVGERGFSTLERRWLRPACDVVGMSSGFQGPPGTVKTITPARGLAKVVCRLVPGQRPDEVLEAARRHVEALNELGGRSGGGGGGVGRGGGGGGVGRGGGGGGKIRGFFSKLFSLVGLSSPFSSSHQTNLQEMLRGARVTFAPLPFSAVPYEMSRDSPALKSVERVLAQLHAGQSPVKTWMGGSIPATSAFKKHLRGIDTALFAFGLARDRVHSPDESYLLSQFEKSREGYVRVLFDLGGGAEGEQLERDRRKEQQRDEL